MIISISGSATLWKSIFFRSKVYFISSIFNDCQNEKTTIHILKSLIQIFLLYFNFSPSSNKNPKKPPKKHPLGWVNKKKNFFFQPWLILIGSIRKIRWAAQHFLSKTTTIYSIAYLVMFSDQFLDVAVGYTTLSKARI
mgnify:CR=1 FL=1